MVNQFFLFKKVVLALIALCFFCNSYSQNVITGTVTDTLNNELAFVNIALLNASDSSNAKGTISDEHGKFEISHIKAGNYRLKLFSVGFDEYVTEALKIDSSSNISLGKIVLAHKGINLNEVSVTSLKKTIEFKNGMTVMNVENSIMAAGNTVLDVLKRIPGVTVDNKNNISISGKQGVRIMLDGRMQQLSMEQIVSMLSAMTADQLSKIEIMKNPPVKYDAQGNAGVINIVSKKVTTKGYSGNITYNPGMGQRFGNSVYAALNFKSNKLTVFSNINLMYKTFYDRYEYHKYITYQGNTTHFSQNGDHENLRRYVSGKMGLDYALTKKTTIGFLASTTINKANFRERGLADIYGYNDVGFGYYKYETNEDLLWKNPNYNFNAEHKFDTLGTVLSVAVDYSGFNNNAPRKSESKFFNSDHSMALPTIGYQSNNKSNISIFTQKIDFQKNLTPSWLLETGAKTTFVNNNSDLVFKRLDVLTSQYIVDTAFTNNYKYKENLIAGYLNIRKQFKKGSLGLGVRAENTEITGHNVTSGFKLTRSYLNFFPNISFDYQLTDKQNIQFSYNRRLERPDYSRLNPFKIFEDQYAVGMGNPYLNPQYSDNFDFVHVYNQWLTNSIGYAYLSQPFSDVTYQNDSTKVSTFTLINLNKYDYYYYNLFLQKQLKQWWNVEFSLNVFYVNGQNKINSKIQNTSLLSCNVYFNNDFILPKNFKIQLTGHYNAPSQFGPNYNKANGSCDFGIKKTLYKGKFNVMLQFLDMFYTDINRSVYDFDNQYYTFTSRDDTRRFRLTLSYKFGKMNIRLNEKYSNTQETGRLKKD